MKNILQSSKKLYDAGVLEPHERWVRSKQVGEMVAKHDKNGHEVHVPIFDTGIMSIESLGVREFGDE